MQLDDFICQLKTLQQHLTAKCQSTATALIHVPYFDQTLFNSNHRTLADYQQEISQNIETLQGIKTADPQVFQWLCEKIVHQLSALKILTQPHTQVQRSTKLSQSEQYQHYFQRLEQCYQQAEQRLSTASTLTEQQEIGKEMTVLLQRLQRCQTAIDQQQWHDLFNHDASN